MQNFVGFFVLACEFNTRAQQKFNKYLKKKVLKKKKMFIKLIRFFEVCLGQNKLYFDMQKNPFVHMMVYHKFDDFSLSLSLSHIKQN